MKLMSILINMLYKDITRHDIYLKYKLVSSDVYPRGHTLSIKIFCKNYGSVWRVPSTITALSSDYNSYCHSNSSYATSIHQHYICNEPGGGGQGQGHTRNEQTQSVDDVIRFNMI